MDNRDSKPDYLYLRLKTPAHPEKKLLARLLLITILLVAGVLIFLLATKKADADYRSDVLRELNLENWPDGGGKGYAFVLKYGNRRADYELKIEALEGRDDLSMLQKQMLEQAYIKKGY